MDQEFVFPIQRVLDLVIPLGVFIGVIIGGYILRYLAFKNLEQWADHSKSRVDNIIIQALRGPVILWVWMLAIYLALAISQLPSNIVFICGKTLMILTVMSLALVASNIATLWIKTFSGQGEEAAPAATLTQNVTRLIIIGVGFLVILSGLGISITPLLATLGIGGLAVALALQDTLGNFFAGFNIIATRQVKIGDYVKLDSGEEGYIIDINWRITKVRMLPNNVVIVPNTKLAQAIVVNYYLPEKELAVTVDVGVHYNSDLDQVERVTCDVAREVMREVKGGVSHFEPFIRFNKLDSYSINFTVIMRAREFTDQYLVKHEFFKRLVRRYRQEGIIIPYPIQAENFDQENVPEDKRRG